MFRFVFLTPLHKKDIHVRSTMIENVLKVVQTNVLTRNTQTSTNEKLSIKVVYQNSSLVSLPSLVIFTKIWSTNESEFSNLVSFETDLF